MSHPGSRSPASGKRSKPDAGLCPEVNLQTQYTPLTSPPARKSKTADSYNLSGLEITGVRERGLRPSAIPAPAPVPVPVPVPVPDVAYVTPYVWVYVTPYVTPNVYPYVTLYVSL